MKHVAILIAASPNEAFFSQIAAMELALSKLNWTRWTPTIYAYFSGEGDGALRAWRPYLRRTVIVEVSDHRFEPDDLWAQSDAVLELAPRNADVLLAMDADTLPVRNFEAILDRVVETRAVAGVVAHFPFPHTPSLPVQEAWEHVTHGIIRRPLEFNCRHTLVDETEQPERIAAPFYLNFGVVFFAECIFNAVAVRYLAVRPRIMERMSHPDFSGQIALTVAFDDVGVAKVPLPMRFNFPNDPIAERLHPEEKANAVIYHYLRTGNFDRHKIFTGAREYERFLSLPLRGSDADFQSKVRTLLGAEYPFAH